MEKMATKKQTDKIIKSLKRIESNLDMIIRLKKATMPKQTVTPVEKEILKLCDTKHTKEDIITITKKTKTHVETLLSSLRKKFRIESVKKGDKIVYKRI